MRFFSEYVFTSDGYKLDGYATTLAFNSKPISLKHASLASIHVVASGTLSASVKVQGSSQLVANPSSITNWVDLAAATTLDSSNPQLYNIQAGYSYVRLVLTSPTGTGNCSAWFTGKGWS